MTRKTLAAAAALACALPLLGGAAHAKPLVVRTPILVQPPQPGPGPCIQCGSRIKVGGGVDPVVNPTTTLPTGTLTR